MTQTRLHLTPSEFRTAMREMAAKSKKTDREKAAKNVGAVYTSLRRDIDTVAADDQKTVPGTVSASTYLKNLKSKVAGGATKAERLKAAEKLAEDYTELFYHRDAVVKSSPFERIGRDGRVVVNADRGSTGNPRLDALIEAVRRPRPVWEPSALVTGADGQPASCLLKRVAVTVRKPGAAAAIGEVAFSPDFLQYLREKGKLHLRSFEEWIDASEIELAADASESEVLARRRDYETDVARQHERFEKKLLNKRRCQPGDLAMPGVQRGYRLLRLPTTLTAEDFRDRGCGGQIYEGSAGPAAPPAVDYAELVRRYVEHLSSLPESVYDLSGITDVDIHASHRDDLGLVATNILELFVQGSKIALAHPDLRTRLRQLAPGGAAAETTVGPGTTIVDRNPNSSLLGLANRSLIDVEAGVGLVGAAPSIHALAAWLRSDAAAEVRLAVFRAWQGLVSGQAAPVAQPASGAVPPDAMTANDFTQKFTEVCVPLLPNLAKLEGDPPVSPFEPGEAYAAGDWLALEPSLATPDGTTAGVAHIIGLLTTLAEQYDQVWSAAAANLGTEGLWDARNRGDIVLSGLEAKATIYHLAALAYKELATSRRPSAHKAGVANALATAANDIGTPIGAEDVLPGGKFFVPGTGVNKVVLSADAETAIKAVAESYANALDAILSFLPAAGAAATPATTGPAPIRERDLPVWYQRWTQSLARLVDEHVRTNQVVGDNLLILRLTQRSGRYGEVPQRPQRQELTPEPKAHLWPGHPARLTEKYALEPIPDEYFFQHRPGLFLREDYSLSIRHRGYGIGANLYSMSLLPEESQKIVMKSFKDTTTKISENTAENIFEEAGSETASDFAEEMQRENQRETSNAHEFSLNTKVSGGTPFVKGSIEAGYSAQDSAKDFAKNTSGLTQRLANKFSSKRNVAIDVQRSKETEEVLHTEIQTEREIRNPNLGHTVTFHWFQMTRKLNQELRLEDARSVYTSGKHNVARVFVNGELPNLGSRVGELRDEMFAAMPEDVARRMPPNSAIVVVTEPYTEVVPMAAVNAFLGRTLTPAKAGEVNGEYWRVLGHGEAAPDGLGITAFPGHRRDQATYAAVDSTDPTKPGAVANTAHVAADVVTVKLAGSAEETLYLPNLDLRYKAADGQAPRRFTAPPHESFALPRLLAAEERVVNTNGVFCDAMVGQCTALDDYLERHRDLDLLEKKLAIGKSEADFRWELAKNNLDVILSERGEAVVAMVKTQDGEEAFKDQLEVEHEQLKETKAIAAARLKKQRLEKELEELGEEINERKKRVKLMGTAPAIKIDAPDGATVGVNADVHVDGADGGSISVE